MHIFERAVAPERHKPLIQTVDFPKEINMDSTLAFPLLLDLVVALGTPCPRPLPPVDPKVFAMWIVALLFVLGGAMMFIEAKRPGRQWPEVSGWWARAVAFNGVQVALVWVAGVLWDGWMQDHALFSIAHFGVITSALLGYFILTFVYYWWHRARHASPLLWRLFHQMHHSPQRLEVITSFYKHPLEITANALLSSTVMYLILGLSPQAAALATLASGLAEFFYHWNVKTPRWIGYLIQRPESHCVHHQQGIHHHNYGDLPLWDMLFGTFHNPKDFEAACGFAQDAECRLGDILRCHDVQPPQETP